MDIKKEVIRVEQEMVNFLNELKGKDLRFKLNLIITMFTNQFEKLGLEKPPFDYKNNREALELAVVFTEMSHCLYFEEDLTMSARIKDLKWSPLYNYLADIKVKHFMQEICGENGIEVIDIVANGFVVRVKEEELN